LTSIYLQGISHQNAETLPRKPEDLSQVGDGKFQNIELVILKLYTPEHNTLLFQILHVFPDIALPSYPTGGNIVSHQDICYRWNMIHNDVN